MLIDKTRVAVRERPFLELLELALQVLREDAAPILRAAAVGIVPAMVLNVALLGPLVWEFVGTTEWLESGYLAFYLALLALLLCLEAPLAMAPLTLYLGQAVFARRADWTVLRRELRQSLPQLLWSQILPRAVCMLPFLLATYPHLAPLGWTLGVIGLLVMIGIIVLRGYINEIILLERNPWKAPSGDPRAVTTRLRSRFVHSIVAGDLLAMSMAGLVLGAFLAAGLSLSLQTISKLLAPDAPWNIVFWLIHVQLAVWAVVSYFTIVKFLGYLDMRIRMEGWELELQLRVAGARIASKLQ